MNPLHLSFLLVVSSISICSLVSSQQPYTKQASFGCSVTDPSTSVYGYSCNGETRSCQSYLTFLAQPSYNTVSSISALLAADPSQLSRLNSVPLNATFDTGKTVLVPVNCSCSGPYYQLNSSYIVQPNETLFTIPNNVFEALTTCVALQAQNNNLTPQLLYPGTTLTVPLRCACPTKNQSDNGIKYLLSYVVNSGQSVSSISAMFGVDTGTTLQANGLSEDDFNIYPDTTLLIPLQNPPSSSQIIEAPPPPLQQPTPTPASPPSSGSSSKSWVYAVVGVVAGLAIATISGLLVYFLRLRKRKEERVTNPAVETPSFESIEKPSPDEKFDLEKSQTFWNNITSIAKSINVYTYKELQRATENFSPTFWIKGPVYRGVINGDLAAIKKKIGDVSEEVNLLNKINHFNLIRLSGVCFNEGQWYLVYEYAANGPLSDWIHSKKGNDTKLLSWKQRIQIALDIATGLNYLHCYTSPPHVHKDLTSSNVFLDTDLRAKIGNIGRARSADGEGEFALTRHIVGTKGYMAPEYLENGLVSPKLDVYAFGVLLMEIISGKEVAAIPEIQLPLLEGKDAIEYLSSLLDPSLQGEHPSELAILVVKLIDSCLQINPSARPSTPEIVQTLSTIVNTILLLEHKTSISVDRSLHTS